MFSLLCRVQIKYICIHVKYTHLCNTKAEMGLFDGRKGTIKEGNKGQGGYWEGSNKSKAQCYVELKTN